jgi:AbrB family looped-hinge helix DNA binding protein
MVEALDKEARRLRCLDVAPSNVISFNEGFNDMRSCMDSVKVSPKFQIVIPRRIRESMNIKPGEAMQVFELEGRIEVVRVRPVRSLRGRYPGIDTSVERDEDRI